MTRAVLASSLAFGLLASALAQQPPDERQLPASLTADQKANLLKFLKDTERPDRYIPKGAKFGDTAPSEKELAFTGTKDQPIKQFTAQITPHRPTPDQEKVTKADVFYYRPNPEKGKPGVTVKYTIDLATGQPVGEPEVLTKAHVPVSREELAEAISLAQNKVPAVKELYDGREAGVVRWEYLQMKINRKTDQFEPGDRVVRLVFTAPPAAEGQRAPEPVRVIVNVTRETVQDDK
ncbi:MAG: hypothetical protein K2V38_04355 [Gemmataceae bacterium]|nr:hypothetical protein [Gemmataceae bacterium]